MKVIQIKKQKAKQFKFGDKVLVLKDGTWITKGTTGIVWYADEDEDVHVFTEDDEECFSPHELRLLEPNSKESEEGKYEEGQKFRVITAGRFEVGDIVTLTYDDGTDRPEFTRDSDGLVQWVYLSNLEPLSAEGQETTVTLELTLEELHLIEATSGKTSFTDVKGYFSTNHFPEILSTKHYEFYMEIKDIRKEAE